MSIIAGKLYKWKEAGDDIIVMAKNPWYDNHKFSNTYERWDIEIVKGERFLINGQIFGTQSSELLEYQDPVDILKEML